MRAAARGRDIVSPVDKILFILFFTQIQLFKKYNKKEAKYNPVCLHFSSYNLD